MKIANGYLWFTLYIISLAAGSVFAGNDGIHLVPFLLSLPIAAFTAWVTQQEYKFLSFVGLGLCLSGILLGYYGPALNAC